MEGAGASAAVVLPDGAPDEVVMHLAADQLAPPFTWSSTGAIEDEGTWSDVTFFFAAVRSPVVGTLHDEILLVGSGGTIDLRFEGLLTPTPDPEVFELDASWRVLGGTGSYEGVHGGGSGLVEFRFADSAAEGDFIGRVVQPNAPSAAHARCPTEDRSRTRPPLVPIEAPSPSHR
jgi:hypothetical protein